jgi:hypothetical protein
VKKTVAALLSFLLVACGSIDVNEYRDAGPKLDMRTFFDGELKAYGILQDRSGKVTRKFTADIDASWMGNKGVLDETFYFDDGETSKRVWQLELQGNRVVGTAGDVVGEASGEFSGNALFWRYVLTIPYKEKTIDITIDDWLYLVTENKLINKSVLKKFGFRVGDLTLLIEKTDK